MQYAFDHAFVPAFNQESELEFRAGIPDNNAAGVSEFLPVGIDNGLERGDIFYGHFFGDIDITGYGRELFDFGAQFTE